MYIWTGHDYICSTQPRFLLIIQVPARPGLHHCARHRWNIHHARFLQDDRLHWELFQLWKKQFDDVTLFPRCHIFWTQDDWVRKITAFPAQEMFNRLSRDYSKSFDDRTLSQSLLKDQMGQWWFAGLWRSLRNATPTQRHLGTGLGSQVHNENGQGLYTQQTYIWLDCSSLWAEMATQSLPNRWLILTLTTQNFASGNVASTWLTRTRASSGTLGINFVEQLFCRSINNKSCT